MKKTLIIAALMHTLLASPASAQSEPGAFRAPAAQDQLPKAVREAITRYDAQCEATFHGIPGKSPGLVKIADVTRDGIADYVVDFNAYECLGTVRPVQIGGNSAGNRLTVFRGILTAPASNPALPDDAVSVFSTSAFASRVTMDKGFAVITVALTADCGRRDAAGPVQADLRWCGRVLNSDFSPRTARPSTPWTAGEVASTAGNYAEAARLWTAAADQGDARSMINLGNLYAQGKGVGQSDAWALTWYRRAAETPVVLSPAPLGVSFSEANELYGAAGADVDAVVRDMAMLLVATAFDEGRGVSRDRSQAAAWYRLWANATDNPARRAQRLTTLADLHIQP